MVCRPHLERLLKDAHPAPGNDLWMSPHLQRELRELKIRTDAVPQDCLRLEGFFLISEINQLKLFQKFVCSFDDFM